MTAVLYLATYCALVTFAIGCLRRARQYAKLPVHLRWELYPVPHEPSPRAAHGGSYFEESEWWTKPRRINRLSELWVMLREIFLLETVRKAKPALWWRSQLFHSGVFLVTAAVCCDLLATVGAPLAVLGRVAGYFGLLLVLTGSLVLLWRRITDSELVDFTHVADRAQLVVLTIAALLLLIGTFHPNAPSVPQFARAVVSFDMTIEIPWILTAGILLSAALFAYIPFSRMAHFIGKYFAYHAVRWDDQPNHGGRLGQSLAKNLQLKPTWAATHILGDGAKTWAEIASENPAEMRR